MREWVAQCATFPALFSYYGLLTVCGLAFLAGRASQRWTDQRARGCTYSRGFRD